MGDLARPTGQVHDDRYDELGIDHLEKAVLLEGLRVPDGVGDHPRKSEREHRVGEDPVLSALNRDDVRKPDQTGLGRRIMRFERLSEYAPEDDTKTNRP
jgi:hypothetical protein